MINSILRALGAVALTSSLLAAQAQVIPVSGQLWDGNGGPFLAGKVYHVSLAGSGISVPAGRTLTIQPGAIVKIDNLIYVQGQLNARGATFTSWHDDQVGGDSNNNGGATVPARGDWIRLDIGGTTTLLEDCKFRYGGASNVLGATVLHRGGAMTMQRCIVEHSKGDALKIAGRSANSTVVDSEFRLSGGIAINGVALRYLSQLQNNKASNCDGGDYVKIGDGYLDATDGTMTMTKSQSLNQGAVFVISSKAQFVAHLGSKLVVSKGLTLKFERGVFARVRLAVEEELIAIGTATQPIVFTSLRDDSFGGDTNKDGNATVPAPHDWNGILLGTKAGTSRLTKVVVRFGGSSGQEDAGIAIHGSAVEVKDCVIDSNMGAGLYSRGGANGFPRVTGCSITNNSTIAGKNIPWQSLVLCSGNTASGNGGGDYFSAITMNPKIPLEIGPENYPGDVLVVVNKLLLGGGGELDLRAGTILKFHNVIGNGLEVSQGGALRANGTATQPVIMTSIHDDTVAGDTNANGNATQAKPGQWRQVSFGDNRVTAPSLLENVIIRYAGKNSGDAVRCHNSRLSIRSVRIEHAAARGMEVVRLNGHLDNVVVRDAGSTGIRINTGSFDIRHATVIDCGGIGMNSISSGYTGAVRSSIVWNNAGGNFGGTLTATNVFSSDGDFAGVNGNINQAPQFVNATAGDLHLTSSSPCLARGDLATALSVRKDHEENSRVLDPAFSGIALPDMGAYERWTYGLKASGTATIGNTINFTVEGPSGLSTAFLGLLDGGFFLAPYGIELAGASIIMLASNPVPVGQAISMTLPYSQSLIGLKFGVQGVGLSQANGFLGGFTNLYRAQVN